MRRLILTTALLVGLAAPAWASLVTINCDDPEGFVLHHGENLLRGPGVHHEAGSVDRFGSKPTFILDSKRPNKLIVIWGSYIPEGVSEELVHALDREAKAVEADIVLRNDHQITAIEKSPQGVYTYSLYPNLNYGVITHSGYWATEEHAWASIYFGECHFSE